MNGFMAPLLVMMMTGMVFCQQPQSNSFGSGNGGEAESGRLLGKYLLVINPELVRGLKTQGFLQAEIDPVDRSTIDHIVFHGNERNSLNETLNPVDITQTPSSDDDPRLEFKLTDELIGIMRRRGLRYIIRPEEVGDYNEVVVLYDRPTTTPVRERNHSIDRNNSINQDRNLYQNQGFARRENEPFIGPRLPAQSEYNQRQAVNNNGSFTPRIGSLDNNVTENQNRSRQIRSDLELNNNRFDRVARNDRNRDMDFGINDGRDNSSNDRSLEYRDQRDRSLQNARGIMDADEEIRLQRLRERENSYLDQQQLAAENDRLKRLLSDEQKINERQERQLDSVNRARLAAENAMLRRNREELDNAYDGTYRRAPIDYTADRARRMADNDRLINTQSTERQAYVGMPSRTMAKPRPTGRPPELAINGPIPGRQIDDGAANLPTTVNEKLLADAERVQRNQQVLWFIMLCSVGLNFYLALIARSFYVRYEELADELRDTFTSSTM